MKTWNKEKKQKWVSEMQEHQEADRLIRGEWLNESNQGCFFGCAMQTEESPLEKAITDMSLPSWLIYLAEKIYEGLPNNEYLDFPVKLLKSIPIDIDITSVRHAMAISRLNGLINSDNGEDVNDSIRNVISCHESPQNSDWSAARSAAWSAESAAWSAESAARSAAWSTESAAESAAWSAESAAWSAAWSAESAARSAAWSAESKLLIKLLSEFDSNGG